MNGKKAKLLRRESEKLTVGMPEVSYRQERVDKQKLVQTTDSNGMPINREENFICLTTSLNIACTRKVYQDLKMPTNN